MRLPPPEVVASWPQPNRINPEHRGSALLIVELVLLPVALVALALRLHVRIRIVSNSGWDDWLMVVAAGCGVGITICDVLATQLYGWNAHVWDLTLQQIMHSRKVWIAGQTLLFFTTSLTRASVLISYLRIAPDRSCFRQLTLGTLGVVVAGGLAFLVSVWCQCRPISAYWSMPFPASDPSACRDEASLLLAQTIFNLLADLLVLILPIPMLASMQLRLGNRVAVIGLFGFWLVVVVAAGMHLYCVLSLVATTYDVTWEGFNLWIWNAVEVHLGVICGCVTVLKPLFSPSSSSSCRSWLSPRGTGSPGGTTAPRNEHGVGERRGEGHGEVEKPCADSTISAGGSAESMPIKRGGDGCDRVPSVGSGEVASMPNLDGGESARRGSRFSFGWRSDTGVESRTEVVVVVATETPRRRGALRRRESLVGIPSLDPEQGLRQAWDDRGHPNIRQGSEIGLRDAMEDDENDDVKDLPGVRTVITAAPQLDRRPKTRIW